jgi:tetratricopeptide (TPR) repeat protein
MLRVEPGTARRMLSFQEEDLPVFQEAALQYPDLGAAHIALAEVAASLGHHELALAASEAAVRADPQPDFSWMRLGQELQHAGRLAEAKEAMEVALEKDPTNPNYHAAIAAVLLAEPDGLDQARGALMEALRLDPKNTWAWTLLASAERRAGNPPAAVRAAERSVELEPHNAWTRLALAASQLAMGRTGDALQTLEQAALLDMDSGARGELARNLLLCGEPRRAREEALAAIEQEPGSLGGFTVLAHAETTLGQWEPAVHAWREVVALDPSNSSALVQLARALGMSDRRREALETLVDAGALAKDDPQRIREVAIVLDELRSTDEAISAWQRVLALAPEGELKKEARRRLSSTPRSE